MKKRHIFLIGVSEPDAQRLDALAADLPVKLHRALDERAWRSGRPVPELLETAARAIELAHGPVDGLLSGDAPFARPIASILAERYGAIAPTLESVIRAEHRFLLRSAQQRCAPETTPDFQILDPKTDDLTAKLPFPFWLEPVYGQTPQARHLVESPAQLRSALPALQAWIEPRADLAEQLLGMAKLTTAERLIHARCMIAEPTAPTDSVCFSVEGLAPVEGSPQSLAVIDEHRWPGRDFPLSFSGPSSAPRRVQARALSACAQLLQQLRYAGGAFCARFLWSSGTDALRLDRLHTHALAIHDPVARAVWGTSPLARALAAAAGLPVPLGLPRMDMLSELFLWQPPGAAQASAMPELSRELQEALPGTVLRRPTPGERTAGDTPLLIHTRSSSRAGLSAKRARLEALAPRLTHERPAGIPRA